MLRANAGPIDVGCTLLQSVRSLRSCVLLNRHRSADRPRKLIWISRNECQSVCRALVNGRPGNSDERIVSPHYEPSNRLARAVDRARELSKQLEVAAETRTLLLLRGLRSFYVALGGFAFAALISLLGAALVPINLAIPVQFLEVCGVAAGLLAVGALVHGSTLLLRETKIAVQVISQRVATVRAKHTREVDVAP
jgi:hypothetical protein